MSKDLRPQAATFLLLLLSIAAWFGTVVAVSKFTGSYPRTLASFGVPPMPYAFADARYIANSWEALSHRPDQDIFRFTVTARTNAGIRTYPYNYPPWILLAADLGASSRSLYCLVAGVILAFLISVSAIFPFRSTTHFLLLTGLIMSPPVMLGIERANLDLLVFAFVAFAIILSSKPAHALSSTLLMWIAGCLKLHGFPAGIVFAGARPLKPALVMSGVFLAASVAFLISPWSGASTVSSFVPQDTAWSTGAKHWALWLGRIQGHIHDIVVPDSQASLMGKFTVALLLAAATTGAFRFRKSLQVAVASQNWLLLVAGAAHFVACYSLNMSYMYRKTSLLLCIPLVLSWFHSPGRRRFLGMLLYVLVLSCFWVHLLPPLTVPSRPGAPIGTTETATVFLQCVLDFLTATAFAVILGAWLIETLETQWRSLTKPSAPIQTQKA